MEIIPFDDRDGTIWLNGEMIPWRKRKHIRSATVCIMPALYSKVSDPTTAAFLKMNGTPSVCESGRILDFDLPYSDEEIMEAKRAVLDANGIVDGYVRACAGAAAR